MAGRACGATLLAPMCNNQGVVLSWPGWLATVWGVLASGLGGGGVSSAPSLWREQAPEGLPGFHRCGYAAPKKGRTQGELLPEPASSAATCSVPILGRACCVYAWGFHAEGDRPLPSWAPGVGGHEVGNNKTCRSALGGRGSGERVP